MQFLEKSPALNFDPISFSYSTGILYFKLGDDHLEVRKLEEAKAKIYG